MQLSYRLQLVTGLHLVGSGGKESEIAQCDLVLLRQGSGLLPESCLLSFPQNTAQNEQQGPGEPLTLLSAMADFTALLKASTAIF